MNNNTSSEVVEHNMNIIKYKLENMRENSNIFHINSIDQFLISNGFTPDKNKYFKVYENKFIGKIIIFIKETKTYEGIIIEVLAPDKEYKICEVYPLTDKSQNIDITMVKIINKTIDKFISAFNLVQS